MESLVGFERGFISRGFGVGIADSVGVFLQRWVRDRVECGCLRPCTSREVVGGGLSVMESGHAWRHVMLVLATAHKRVHSFVKLLAVDVPCGCSDARSCDDAMLVSQSRFHSISLTTSQKKLISDQQVSNNGDIGRNKLSFLDVWYDVVELATAGSVFSNRQPYVSDFFPRTRLVLLPLPLVDMLRALIECTKQRFAEVRRTFSDSSCIA